VGDEHPAYAPAGAWLPLPLPKCQLTQLDYKCSASASSFACLLISFLW